jgi:hypothetical protein
MTFYLLSFWIRSAVLLLAFFILLNVGVLQMVTALAGFIVTRFALVRCLGLTTPPGLRPDARAASVGPTETGTG